MQPAIFSGHYRHLLLLSILGIVFKTVQASIYCYNCVSNEPGCGEDGVNFWVHSSISCPKDDDRCVKIIEQNQSDVLITRSCLSELVATRTDVPGDKYDGCRPGAPNPKIANHVNNDMQEAELRGLNYDNVTWCFCNNYFCNGSTRTGVPSIAVLSIATAILTAMLCVSMTHDALILR